MTETISPDEAARRFQRLADRLVPDLVDPVEEVLSSIARRSRSELEKRSLFRREEAPPLIVLPTRVRETGDGLEGTVEVHGMAAIFDAGGKTAPHEILPRGSGSVLKFEGRMGTVFRPRASHPGSRFSKHGILEDAGEKADRDAGPSLDRAVQDTIRQVGLA